MVFFSSTFVFNLNHNGLIMLFVEDSNADTIVHAGVDCGVLFVHLLLDSMCTASQMELHPFD